MKIPTLTELGKKLKITNPYSPNGYTKLLHACAKEAEKKGFKSWIDIDSISLLPEFVDRLKAAEAYWSELTFASEPYLNKSPNKARNIKGIIPLTTAQILWLYRQGYPLDAGKGYWYIDCIAEMTTDGRVPYAFWSRSFKCARLDGNVPDNQRESFGARSAARLDFEPQTSLDPYPLSLDMKIEEIVINGTRYRKVPE